MMYPLLTIVLFFPQYMIILILFLLALWLLLSGDASYAAIEDKVRDYDIVQLPHHGKSKQADKIFAKKCDQISTIYIVSDNTGNSNGGSDDLKTTGHRVYNTKHYGNIKLNSLFFSCESPYTGRSLGTK